MTISNIDRVNRSVILHQMNMTKIFACKKCEQILKLSNPYVGLYTTKILGHKISLRQSDTASFLEIRSNKLKYVVMVEQIQ